MPIFILKSLKENKYIVRDTNKDSQEIASVSFVNEDTGDYEIFELHDFNINENEKGVKIGQKPHD